MSLSTSLGITSPRFQILSADYASVLKTLYLPTPTNDGIDIVWEEVGTGIVTLANGSKRKKIKGYAVRMVIKWDVYDDLPGNNSRSIGTADGQIPPAEDLIAQLSLYGESRLQFSPSTADPFFRCFIGKAPTLTTISNVVFKNFQLEVIGRDLFASSDLSAAIVA